MPPILEALDLTKNYGDFTAVKAISFHIQEGEIFSLLGPNGAGKTTTISMLSTLYSHSMPGRWKEAWPISSRRWRPC